TLLQERSDKRPPPRRCLRARARQQPEFCLRIAARASGAHGPPPHQQEEKRTCAVSFNHLVGANEQRRGHSEAERLCRLDIDRQQHLVRELDRQPPPEVIRGGSTAGPSHSRTFHTPTNVRYRRLDAPDLTVVSSSLSAPAEESHIACRMSP